MADREELLRARETGRFLPKRCPDPNCDGSTVLDYEDAWIGGPREAVARCDGLTHMDDYSPLFACPRVHLAAASLRPRAQDPLRAHGGGE